MAYSEGLADRTRTLLNLRNISFEEKKMMGGLCYMVDDKMCCGIIKNDFMARVGPENYEFALTKKGARTMDFTGRPMKGYVFVSEKALDLDADLEGWVELCLAFNPIAKSSKKK